MLRSTNICLMAGALALAAWCGAEASAGDWERLGSRQVAFGGDRDTISCAHEGLFNAIKIDVDRGNLIMYDVKVTFGDGSTYSPPTRLEFKQGQHSRTIDLPGNARRIKKVEFLYKSTIRRGRATVHLWGRHAGPAATPGPAVKPGQWEKIGSRVVAFGGDKDTISGLGDGRFVAIKLDVDRGNLELYNIKVTFGDGTSFSPETRLTFHENSRSRTIDLPGAARIIRKIEFWYKSKIRNGRATMTVYGKHPGGGTAAGGTPVAKPGQWDKIGSRVVDFGGDKDTISGFGDGRFVAIKLDVDRGNLELYNIKVTFGDGSSFSPETRLLFHEDTRSRTIDLPGAARLIRKIEFWYKSKVRNGRATMTVYGKHPSASAGGTGTAAVPLRWEKLGSRQVAFGGDKDTIACAHEGRFTAIKLNVVNGNLAMYNIKVTFGDGSSFSPETRLIFKEGERSRTIDLPGGQRVIRKVEFWYKSKLNRGRATVNLYGRHGG